MRVLFIEPPKDFWFVMGEYLPPPTVALQVAAHLEVECPQDEITVLDCQAERLDWSDMVKRIEAERPHLVAVSSLAMCNAFTVARALDSAKKVALNAFTITGGQHFTALAEPSLMEYPSIGAIVRGEGEETLVEVADALDKDGYFSDVLGLTYRRGLEVVSNPDRPLMRDINALPMPGYHFVEDNLDSAKALSMMAPKTSSSRPLYSARLASRLWTFIMQWQTTAILLLLSSGIAFTLDENAQ